MLFVVLYWKELKTVILTEDLCTEITAIEHQELGEVCACSQTWVRLLLPSKQNDTVLYFILCFKKKKKDCYCNKNICIADDTFLLVAVKSSCQKSSEMQNSKEGEAQRTDTISELLF